MGLIYMATNKVNGKSYIGLTTGTLENRRKQHKSQAKRVDGLFQRAINKYGWDNFSWEVLEDGIDSIDDLNKREIYYIDKYDTFNKGYNMTLGGEGIKIPYIKYTDEFIRLVIKYICETNLSYLEIAKVLGCNKYLVNDIGLKRYREDCWDGKINPREDISYDRNIYVTKESLERIFVMYYIKGFSCRYIASQIDGISEGYIKKFVTKKIQKRMEWFNEFEKKYKDVQFVEKPKGMSKLTYDLAEEVFVKYYIDNKTYDEIILDYGNTIGKTTIHDFINGVNKYSRNWIIEFCEKYSINKNKMKFNNHILKEEILDLSKNDAELFYIKFYLIGKSISKIYKEDNSNNVSHSCIKEFLYNYTKKYSLWFKEFEEKYGKGVRE